MFRLTTTTNVILAKINEDNPHNFYFVYFVKDYRNRPIKMSNNDDDRKNNTARAGGGNGGDGNRIYPNDSRYDFHENVRRVFLAPNFSVMTEERTVYARCLANLISHDETVGAQAVALYREQQRRIQEIPSVDTTAAQRATQSELEMWKYSKLVVEHHAGQSARLLDDLSVQAAHLIVNAMAPSEQLTAFMLNIEARVMMLMQTSPSLEHEEYGCREGNKKRKSDKS